MAKNPPLAIAVIGTGETPAKNIDALLNDFTSPYEDVAFILPVDDEHWTDTIGAVHEWIVANDIPYVAVTDGTSPGKALVPVLEGADSTIKVARVSTKMVQLLKTEANEGSDAALLVAWEDDDAEAAVAVNKALDAEVKALNLCDGLDQFEFEDGEGGGEPADDAPKASDDYEDKGIRALRALLREHPNKGDLSDRKIGQLEKDDAIATLRKLDAGGDDEPAEEPKETRTTRARRAFAEGAAEGTGDEAQTELPNSRGGDVLDTETDGPKTEAANPNAVADPHSEPDDISLRHRALELAISSGHQGAEAVKTAQVYASYLAGTRRSAGRPRADGTPAEARDIDPETGKPIRRRATRRSSED